MKKTIKDVYGDTIEVFAEDEPAAKDKIILTIRMGENPAYGEGWADVALTQKQVAKLIRTLLKALVKGEE